MMWLLEWWTLVVNLSSGSRVVKSLDLSFECAQNETLADREGSGNEGNPRSTSEKSSHVKLLKSFQQIC
jgi:hypothetical protein